MTFVQLEFVAFMTIVFALYWGFPNRRWQNLLLLVASAIFYGWIHPWFVTLLYASSIVDYFAGIGIVRYQRWKKWIIGASFTFQLGMLAYFKYMDWFLESVKGALDLLGIPNSVHTLGIFLPVGISFYTFQTMSYTIDVYRGELEPRKNFLDYMVFVSFFPQLVAGPIERATNLLPQFERDRVFSWANLWSGFGLAMFGAFKKVVIADTIAPWVDKVFQLNEPTWAILWAGAMAFGIQILTDFSGYTDIARGTARMLGFELMVNFDHPFVAHSAGDFWRRWHISFSTWIRDYVYRPLGGSGGGRFWIMVRSTTITFLVSGVWHGANWNYVVWGFAQAIQLIGYRLVEPRLPAWLRNLPGGRYAAIFLWFNIQNLNWILFRETHMWRQWMYFTSTPLLGGYDQWVAAAAVYGVVGLCATPLLLAYAAELWVIPRLRNTPWMIPLETTTWAVYACAMFAFVRMTAGDFMYFQF